MKAKGDTRVFRYLLIKRFESMLAVFQDAGYDGTLMDPAVKPRDDTVCVLRFDGMTLLEYCKFAG
jgi:hypothetical protein